MCWQEFGEAALLQEMETAQPLGQTARRRLRDGAENHPRPSSPASATTLRRVGSRDLDRSCLHPRSWEHFPQLSKVEVPMDG